MRINKRAISIFVVDISLAFLWGFTKDTSLLGLWITITIFFITEAVMAYYALVGMGITRRSNTNRHNVGEIFKETFEITNKSRFIKLTIELIDESLTGGKINSRVIVKFPSNGKRVYSSSAILLRRGAFSLGPTIIKANSIFGLFTNKKCFPSKKKLLVYPHIIKIDHRKEGSSVDMGGKNVWTYTSNTTPQIAGIREYSPGDPLHRVHWPSTAKHGKLMVKEFDEDSHAQTWILLDAKSNKLADISEIPYTKKTPYLTLKSEKNNQYIPKSSFEYAVCIAASLAEYYIKKKISVGLTAVGKQVINIQPESGQRQLSKILEKLSIIQNEGSQDIFNIFERVKFQIPKGAKVFLISNDSKIKFDQLQKSAMLKKIKFAPIYIDDITFREPFESELKVNQKMAINHELITIHYGDDLKAKLESKIGI